MVCCNVLPTGHDFSPHNRSALPTINHSHPTGTLTLLMTPCKVHSVRPLFHFDPSKDRKGKRLLGHSLQQFEFNVEGAYRNKPQRACTIEHIVRVAAANNGAASATWCALLTFFGRQSLK